MERESIEKTRRHGDDHRHGHELWRQQRPGAACGVLLVGLACMHYQLYCRKSMTQTQSSSPQALHSALSYDAIASRVTPVSTHSQPAFLDKRFAPTEWQGAHQGGCGTCCRAPCSTSVSLRSLRRQCISLQPQSKPKATLIIYLDRQSEHTLSLSLLDRETK